MGRSNLSFSSLGSLSKEASLVFRALTNCFVDVAAAAGSRYEVEFGAYGV